MITVRALEEHDWPAVWTFMEPIIRAGESYPYAMDMTEEGARHMWLEVTHAAYVAEDEDG